MEGLLALIIFRAKLLALLTLIAFFIGERWASFARIDLLAGKYHGFAATLGRKLNRPSRSIATRVYRGITALIILEIPALALGVILSRPTGEMEIVAALAMVALLGRGFTSHTLIKRWKQAKSGSLTLEQDDILFNDTHGVLRHTITQGAEHFSTRVIGSGFWFLLGGLPAMLAYLTLAMAAVHYSPTREENLAFGWAPSRLFRLANAVPRLLAGVVIVLAGLVVPHANPVRALMSIISGAGNWLKLIAELMDVTLGGKAASDAGAFELPWQGSGTAQLTPAHLTRWIALLTTATLLWLLGLLALSLA